VALAAPAAPAVAQGDDETPPAEQPMAEGAAMVEARAGLPSSVRDVPVTGATVERIESEIVSLERTIIDNRRVRDQAIVELERLEGERQGHRTQITTLRDQRRAAGQRAAQLERELATLAVAAYVGAGDPAPGLAFTAGATSDAGRHQVMMEAVDMTLRDRLAVARSEVASLGNQISSAHGELVRVLGEIDETTGRRDRAVAELATAEPALPVAQQRYRDAFMTAPVRGADFPVVALDAYRSGAARINAEIPGCRLSWTVLAGIGRVESRHGTYGGSSLQADGTTTRRIIGIALDGSEGVALIPDTDGGALDGDPVYDRAIGPMQFIPSTWQMVRRDGNGNGRMDPHNIYDASAAAGAYLCRVHRGLDQPGSLNSALLSYNQSQPYVDTVLAHRRAYDQLGLP
jgi:membrane-bound lytic murein transglycosylase B